MHFKVDSSFKFSQTGCSNYYRMCLDNRYDVFRPMHEMWKGYMMQLLETVGWEYFPSMLILQSCSFLSFVIIIIFFLDVFISLLCAYYHSVYRFIIFFDLTGKISWLNVFSTPIYMVLSFQVMLYSFYSNLCNKSACGTYISYLLLENVEVILVCNLVIFLLLSLILSTSRHDGLVYNGNSLLLVLLLGCM